MLVGPLNLKISMNLKPFDNLKSSFVHVQCTACMSDLLIINTGEALGHIPPSILTNSSVLEQTFCCAGSVQVCLGMRTISRKPVNFSRVERTYGH